MRLTLAAFHAATLLMLAPAALAEEKETPKTDAPAESAAAPAVPSDPVVLKVNGDPITQSRVMEIWTGLFPDGKAPDFNSFDDKVRENVLRGIASEQLVFREAMKSGLENDPEVAKKLNDLKNKLITQTYLERQAASKVKDEDIRKVYEQKAEELKGKEEVKARHILVDSEDKADDLLEELEDGTDFKELAKKESLDKASGAKGGDLGWFTDERMVPEFSQAAFKLKEGEVSKPVKTEFGWHVIQVEKRRPVQVPSYEDVKDAIAEELQGKALKAYIASLVDSANIKYYTADGKEREFSKAPDSTAKKD